ncbi:MAG: hypothetical protein AAF366_14145 [Pseudomonadota bacterium]
MSARAFTDKAGGMDQESFELAPSPARRIFGLLTQGLLGLLLIWIGLATPPEDLGWRAFLLVLGAIALVLAIRGWTGSAVPLVLSPKGLYQADGTAVAPLESIESIDRALFTFKPSNGFLIRLKEPLGRAWVPGMWWRVGRRVGVGGVTGGAQTKIVADALSAMVARRDLPTE